MEKINKKMSTLAATVAVATAFCGLCTGAATKVNAEASPANAVATAASDFKVILNPGWNFVDGVKTPNTIEDAGVAKADAATYFVDNAYIANYTVGEKLPAAESCREDMEFLGWRYSKDGELVTVTTMPAATDGDVYLYANWKTDVVGSGGKDDPIDPDPDPEKKTNGLYVGGKIVAPLVVNGGASSTGGLKAEYWLGGGKVTLNKGDVVTIYMNNEQIPFFIDPSSPGINIPTTSETVKSVTVTRTGQFEIYLRDYSDSSKPVNWVCQFAGDSDVEQGSEIPQGCDPIHVNVGTKGVTLYLQTSDGKGVGTANFSQYCIYTFSPEIFGNWATSATDGVVKSEMTGSSKTVPDGWIIRWGAGYGNQTTDIKGAIKDGGTYVIKLPSASKGDHTITEIKAK
ncbi:MAG: hypothetical protein J1G38_00600 [Clostridiales bacterium]|nr:hypothetical protein [Clostridiales bacterium]